MIHQQSSLAPNINQPSVVQKQFYQPPDAHHSSVIHHQSYQAPVHHPSSQASFPQLDSGLVVPSFLPSDDPIASLNKAMAFISTTFASRYPPTNNQLRTSSNPRNQATIQYGKCIKPKRLRNSAWFKEKAMLAEALESGVALDEEQMAFLADNRDTVTTGQASQELVTTTTFQTDDLDAFDSDCDEAPFASAVLIAKLSAYESNVLSEVPTDDTHLDNHVIDQKTENAVVQDTSSTQQDALMSVIEEMSNQVAKCNEVDKVNKTVNESLTAKLERYKEQIKFFEERHKFDLNDIEKYIDSQLQEVIFEATLFLTK
ncbi:hypothetical protein Tco_1040528 [Tanacetum coccineum]